MKIKVTRLFTIAACFAAFFIACSALAFADAERGIMVREAQLFISPDSGSQRISKVERGREVAVIEKSHDFVKVLVFGAKDETPISGWMLEKGVIRASTPNGDRILFGEASDSETEADRRHGRRGAAQEAMR